MSDFGSLFAPGVGAEIERMIDERIAAAFAHRDRSDNSQWFSLAEAAAYLHVSERTLSRLIERKRLRTTCVGRRRLVHRDDLDRVMQSMTGS